MFFDALKANIHSMKFDDPRANENQDDDKDPDALEEKQERDTDGYIEQDRLQ